MIGKLGPVLFGKYRHYHYPRLKENMLPSMRRAKEIMDGLEIQVYNAGVGGELEYFPRVELRSLFKYNKNEELSLFLKAFAGLENKAFSSLQEAFPEATPISSEREWEASRSAIITDVETAVRLVPEVVFTHIPYGPVDGLYLFLKRT